MPGTLAAYIRYPFCAHRPPQMLLALLGAVTSGLTPKLPELLEQPWGRCLTTAPPVAVCLENTFGPDCSLTCEDCQNGGTCNAEGTGCDCPAGWSGLLCNQSEWRCIGAGRLPCQPCLPKSGQERGECTNLHLVRCSTGALCLSCFYLLRLSWQSQRKCPVSLFSFPKRP